MPMFALSAAGAAVGGMFGATSDADDLAEKEAELRWLATQEQVRRMEEADADIISQAEADLAASGFTSSSKSQQTMIRDAEREMQRSRDFTLMMGQAGYDLGMQRADQIGRQSIMSGISSGIGIGSAMGSWFK